MPRVAVWRSTGKGDDFPVISQSTPFDQNSLMVDNTLTMMVSMPLAKAFGTYSLRMESRGEHSATEVDKG